MHSVDRHLYLISYNTQTSTMIVKSMLIVLLLALEGCGSAPKKPAQPEEQPKAQITKPRTDNSKLFPVYSRKYKIVKAAKNEWYTSAGKILDRWG